MMKKFALVVFCPFLFTACAGGITSSKPVENTQNIKHVCIKQQATHLDFKDKDISDWFSQSLAKKHITSEYFMGSKDDCKYLLTYALKGKRKLIVRGTVRLFDFSSGVRTQLGEVVYKYRGDEKDIAKQNGIQGQIDKIVNELFQNY